MGKPPSGKKRELSNSPSKEEKSISNSKKNKNNEMERFTYNKPNNNLFAVLSEPESLNDNYMSLESDSEHEKVEVKKSERKKNGVKNNKNNQVNTNNESENKNKNSSEKLNVYKPTDKGPFIIIMEKDNISDIQTGKRLNELNFKNITNIKKTAQNRLKVQTNDINTANRILKNPTLANIDKIKCFIPNSAVTTVGVIRNIDLDMTEEEILNNATCDCRIIEVERMSRWDSENLISVPSKNIKITFRSSKLPEIFKIYFAPRRVDYYIPKPMLCKKCLIYGHIKKNCKSTNEFCKTCTEIIHEKENQCINKCKYCKNNQHKTGAAECPEEIKQREIKKQMCIKKISFKEANLMVVNETNNQFPKLSNNNISYANIVSTNNKQMIDDLKKKNILLNVIKEKFLSAINCKQQEKVDPILIEIGDLLQKHMSKEPINHSSVTPSTQNAE